MRINHGHTRTDVRVSAPLRNILGVFGVGPGKAVNPCSLSLCGPPHRQKTGKRSTSVGNQKVQMRFEYVEDGEYRIHAGSLELRAGHGHLAAVIVNRSCGGKLAEREIYRDVAVSGGHRWLTPDLALQHALLLGAGAVAAERHRIEGQAVRSGSSV